jgi:outer membrane protein assembly factor BamB
MMRYFLGLLISIILVTACARKETIDGWPCFKGNPARTCLATGEGIKGKPQNLWRFSMPFSIISSPIVFNNILYCGTDSGLIALEAKTGKQIFFFKTGAQVFSTPAADSIAVYFGSWDRNFYAVNRLNGAQIWSLTDSGAFDSSPLIDGI